MESFDQIVPGMTQAQDLANLGFDTRTGNLLPPAGIAARFLLAAGTHPKPLAPAVRDCLKAMLYCNVYIFDSSPAGSAPILFGSGRFRPWSAEITLLVMNGRVTHKVFSSRPRSRSV